MIELHDLKNREYLEKNCIKFEYELELEKSGEIKPVILVFRKNVNDPMQVEWSVTGVIICFKNGFNKIIDFDFSVPTKNMSLTMVCATGINQAKVLIYDWMQNLNIVLIALHDACEGM